MLIIQTTSNDPFYNLAAEEYFLKENSDDIFMLYVDDPSVIVGKHQNTLAEINYRFITENNIRVARRISGGGAVYHDRGNLNFAFIQNGKEGSLVDFRRFTLPVIEALKKAGIDANFEGRNDIRVNGLKVSGNAEHVYKNRVLHHGTLLISSDLRVLSEALHTFPGKYYDNAVKSIRSKVANINDFAKVPYSVEFVKNLILEHISIQNDFKLYNISVYDNEIIQKLAEEKYSTWEWNFGYSPVYEFRNKMNYEENETEIYLKVENGLIVEIKTSDQIKLGNRFKGKRHEYSEIAGIIKTVYGLNDDSGNEMAWSFF
jgi:lipoate---protein ligase